MPIYRLSHCLYQCEYHIVIVTKYRKKIFDKGIFSYFDTKLAEITSHYPPIQFIEVNHDKDHIHMLVSIPPTMSVGKVVGIIKQNTAKQIKKKFPFIKDVYWGTDSIWSEGYFVTTVGKNEAMIKKYIIDQGKKDSGQTLFSV
ncbi:IS200/IS605 family transposase [Candidatus Woesebacteria bacterium]|nr:IS200/IS605 family transposase [Candidatus Woesebacteria bacterium]